MNATSALGMDASDKTLSTCFCLCRLVAGAVQGGLNVRTVPAVGDGTFLVSRFPLNCVFDCRHACSGVMLLPGVVGPG